MRNKTTVISLMMSREMKIKLGKIAEVKYPKHPDLCDHIRTVLSNHIVDCEARGLIE